MTMNSDSDADRLRILPKDVIEAILTRLPIWDAVRTSILARRWRYEWSTLPQIVIDERSFPYNEYLPPPEFERKIVENVDRILLLHHGPINKFKLFIKLYGCTAIDRWILFVSRNGIQELIVIKLIGPVYKLPSCLFAFADLTYLELYRCTVIPSTSFKGFVRLTELHLWHVKSSHDGLGTLLSGCPLLKKLTLKQISGCSHLKIGAQNLMNLTIKGAFKDIHLMSTSLLASASIALVSPDISHVANREGCRIVEVLGHVTSVQRLELLDYTLKHLAVGDVPLRLPEICPMNYLVISINFEDMQEMLAIFCIFRSSLVLQKLDILAISNKNATRVPAKGFWEGEQDLGCRFSHLRAVKITNFTGVTSELEFVKFVLANAPVLEKLRIVFNDDAVFADETDTLKDLLRFPRCSTKAEVIAIS